MNGSYRVITDVSEIGRLNDRLASQLRRTFRVKETREITYPAGHHTGEVFFESSSGDDVRAWSPHTNAKGRFNYVLAGKPGSTKWLEISVQLNFPAATYNRRYAGAFVTDAGGDFFIAHRGKLTKGHAMLKKSKVFREFAARTIEAEDNGQISSLILVAALDDPALADRLWEFGEEAREVATRLAEESQTPEADGGAPSTGSKMVGANPGNKPSTNKDRMLKLRAYFDEYAGEGNSKGHGGGARTVEHGDVVKALEAHMRGSGTTQKAQAIDLAIVAARQVDLFEVKTSARTTDVYTGVGQLLIHGECINELLQTPVRRHLVLPAKPKESHGRHISRKAGINIVLYRKVGASYKFSGIP